MESITADFFENFSRYIIFLHVASMALYIGGLCAMGFFIKPIIFQIKIPKILYGCGIDFVKRFMIFSILCLAFIIGSGFFICIGLELSKVSPTTHIIINTLEVLWISAIASCIYMCVKYQNLKKYLTNTQYVEIHEGLILIFSYVVPLNLFISLACLYFSILLGGF